MWEREGEWWWWWWENWEENQKVYTKELMLSMYLYYCLWFVVPVPLNFCYLFLLWCLYIHSFYWKYIHVYDNFYVVIYIIQQILQYICICVFAYTNLKKSTDLVLIWGKKFLFYRKTKETHLSPRINQLRCQQEISSLPGISKFINAEWSLNLEICFFPLLIINQMNCLTQSIKYPK